MIVKDEFLSRLRKIFDLNLYEVKIWTALLSRGTSTAGELSSISDVPRSRTYDILESLDKKGFVIMKLGKPIKFIEPSDLSGSLRGRQNLYNHIDMMIRSAEKSIVIVTTKEGLIRKMESLMPSLEKAKKRGIKVRIAAQIDSSNIKVARDLKKVAEIKNMEKMKARFIIIDSNQIMFMLLDDEKFHPNYDTGVWINTEFFASALEQLFELAWKDMKSVR